ncbi:hypothetical protein TSAR_016366 [Trichomalopsis sarcophagae]|uniref:Uncharacterized protein n=1 Tax=Trichomalopsis sarcophagae TaxID=543379 RepID=A0A232EL77_9HYME|nr:hypothetical protein TSAR_016366 [Trichomalopsis sarcophagae]
MRSLPENGSINPIVWLELFIRDIYSYIISLYDENDIIGVFYRSLNFARGPGGLSLRLVKNFFYNNLWNLINRLAQIINIPNGGRGGSRKRINIDSSA